MECHLKSCLRFLKHFANNLLIFYSRAEVETALRESKELKLSIQLYADPGYTICGNILESRNIGIL